MILFFTIIGCIYLLSYLNKKTQFLGRLFLNKNEKNYLHLFYTKTFSYYNLLDSDEKTKFIVRVINIRERNQLNISPEIKNTNNDVELLICAAFAQITFGYDDYEITSFNKIIVNPDTFYSKLANHQVKGLTVGTGYIFYSWLDFLKGYQNKNDKINLALHELAHALYIDRFHNTENANWDLWEIVASRILKAENNVKPGFFRTYGQTNLNEFWAVTVECFFEDPINFKNQYAYFYDATAAILRQDMAERMLQNAG